MSELDSTRDQLHFPTYRAYGSSVAAAMKVGADTGGPCRAHKRGRQTEREEDDAGTGGGVAAKSVRHEWLPTLLNISCSESFVRKTTLRGVRQGTLGLGRRGQGCSGSLQ